MIPITIQNKKHKIKSIAELTTKEFIDMSTIDDMDYVKYIAWQTGLTFEKAFFAVTSKTVEQAIGKAPDITKLQVAKWVDKTKLIDTVGLRQQVETSGLDGYKLLVYCLAVSQAHSLNSDDVQALIDKYNEMSFIEILPSGFFFYKNFNRGKEKGVNFSGLLRGLMRIRKSRKAQG